MTNCLVFFVFILIFIEGWMLSNFMKRSFCARLIKVNSLRELNLRKTASFAAIKNRISGEKWTKSDDLTEKALGALQWTMNRVGKVGNSNLQDPLKILKAVESGEGMVCNGMARLYSAVLSAVGISSRLVIVSRNIFDKYDFHMTVEVFLDDKWIVLDPTFNISFYTPTIGYLSSQEIKEHLFHGADDKVQIRFHGEVAYPPRAEKYYMDIRQCFNNVFILEDMVSNRFLQKISRSIYWLWPKIYYEKMSKESVEHLHFLYQWNLVAGVIIPGLVLLSVIGLFFVSR